MPELVDSYLAGDLDLDSLVTRRISLDEVNDAFEAMERQEGIRAVITYGCHPGARAPGPPRRLAGCLGP